MDVVDIFSVLRVADGTECFVLDDLGETDDGVQRDPKFVTDIGQEIHLRTTGELGQLLGAPQFGLDELLFADVDQDAIPEDAAVPPSSRLANASQPTDHSIRRGDAKLARPPFQRVRRPQVQRRPGVAIARMDGLLQKARIALDRLGLDADDFANASTEIGILDPPRRASASADR